MERLGCSLGIIGDGSWRLAKECGGLSALSTIDLRITFDTSGAFPC